MSNDAGPSTLPPPPECMTRDDPSAVTEARLRLAQKQSFFSSLHLGRRKREERPRSATSASSSTSSSTASLPTCIDNQDEPQLLELDGHLLDIPILEEDCDKDVYRWALMYENQRGYAPFVYLQLYTSNMIVCQGNYILDSLLLTSVTITYGSTCFYYPNRFEIPTTRPAYCITHRLPPA